MFRTTSKQNIFSDSYLGWIAQRRTLYGPRTTDALFGQEAAQKALAASPAVQRGAGAGAAGSGVMKRKGDPVRRGARLKPTPAPLLVSEATDSTPSAAAITAAPYLEGEDGPVPFNTIKRRRVQAATQPAAVAPGAMQQAHQVQNTPHANSISTQHLPDPDPTLPGRLVERDKQLPSSGAYRTRDQSAVLERNAGLQARQVPPPNTTQAERGLTAMGGVRTGRGIFVRTPKAAAAADPVEPAGDFGGEAASDEDDD